VSEPDRSRIAAHLDALPPPERESLSAKANYWRCRGVWEAVARMPEPVARRMPRRIGSAWHRLAPDRQRDQVRRNLARVAGHPDAEELDRLVEEAYVSYARYWVDAFRLHRYDPADILRRTDEENLEVVDDLLAGGEGA